jgi:hypothetical protein
LTGLLMITTVTGIVRRTGTRRVISLPILSDIDFDQESSTHGDLWRDHGDGHACTVVRASEGRCRLDRCRAWRQADHGGTPVAASADRRLKRRNSRVRAGPFDVCCRGPGAFKHGRKKDGSPHNDARGVGWRDLEEGRSWAGHRRLTCGSRD